MCKPAYTEACPLRTLLLPWAMRFTSSEELQIKLVEATIAETLEAFPTSNDEIEIDFQLIATMRHVALVEFGLSNVSPGRKSRSRVA
ncbi:hypothetical protein [Agrobacterium tumefaciens]|uniref:hypothetical protein n=1 Tax=Agrobacterium tumefaciens TaxID=358 RepID=UPI00287EC849|nr:hypothetical protein [Agrobacterium tumefaciens]MDS7594661.1 hypothetical protein [Agrobacterium tumefaciens]